MYFSLSQNNQIWFIENPRFDQSPHSHMETGRFGNLTIMTPVLPENTSVFERKDILLSLIRTTIFEEEITNYVLSTGTCKVIPLLRHLSPEKVIYEENLSEAFTHPELFLEMNEYKD